MSDAKQKQPNIQMIPVQQLVPNPWNPNEMPQDAFRENVAEVQRLGKIPKPVVARPVEDKYEIVDGEHAWRAAKEVGFSEVPCEIEDVDDFLAMLETYRRNLSGTNNPLRLGEMFERMKEARGLSNRKLAKEMGLSEGTLRNHLDYVRAFDLRRAHAPETARKDIESLSHREVRKYLELPEAIRDRWLDAGPCVIDLDQVCKNGVYETGDAIVDAGLADLLDTTPGEFRDSFERAVTLGNWRKAHPGISQINAYLRPVAEGRLPAWLLDELPCATANGSTRVCISPKEWASTLKNASAHSTSAADLQLAVQSDIRRALRQKKVDVAEVYGPQVAELLQSLEDAPPFIREAAWLSVEEQYRLAMLEADATEEVILRAKERACELLRCQRAGGKARRGSAIDSVDQAFFQCLGRVQEEVALAKEDELFAAPERLMETVLEQLSESGAICDGVVDGRPAAEVLAERLDAVEWGEFYLLATCLLHTDALELAGQRWLSAVGGHVPRQEENEDNEGAVEETEPEERNDEEGETDEDGYEEEAYGGEEGVEEDDQEEEDD